MLPISGIRDSPVSKFKFILLSDIDFLYNKNIQSYSNDNTFFIKSTHENILYKNEIEKGATFVLFMSVKAPCILNQSLHSS